MRLFLERKEKKKKTRSLRFAAEVTASLKVSESLRQREKIA